MLKTKQKGTTRRGQRLKPGPFSLNTPTRAKAQVQLNRLGQQLKKKLKHGTTIDIVDSVTNEIGWLGLILLFCCVISVCYIIIVIVYSGNNDESRSIDLHSMHNKVHPDHIKNIHDINSHLDDDGSSIDHALHVDPEHWPHHLRESAHSVDTDTTKRDNDRLVAVDDEPALDGDEIRIMSNWDRIWSAIRDVDLNVSVSNMTGDVLSFRAYRIKAAFLHAWHGYAKYAMGHDEIHPVSDLPGDSWGGLGATLIDALDTMMIMGIRDELKEARAKLQEVHFDIDLQVSFFETTIRHLGGLIGAYEMSKVLESEDTFILKQAVSLGDHLLPAFNTVHGIPKSMVNLKSGEIKNYGWTKDRSVLSEVGSNQLEFYALSEYTDDAKYYEKSSNVYHLLDEAKNDEDNDEFGLFPRLIETDTATFPKNEKVYSLGGMSDSFYEYTLKLWILTNYNDKLAIQLYIQSMNAANDKLLRMVYDKKRREKAYFFYGEQWYNKFRGRMEELQCFMPGVLALGSYHALLREEESKKYGIPLTKYEQELIDAREQHLKLAFVLMESCVALYEEMPTGLAPESIEFNDDGWNAKEMKYQLRPETLESLFVLYSLSGDEKYREWAWHIFESIEKHCKTDIAFSGIEDVTEIPAKQDNQMQSYVMAETFKYLFLLFDDDAASLLPLNKFVFNTEAHPIRIMSQINQYKWYSGNDETNENNDDNND